MGHEAFANSAALRESGITRDTPDPPGAAFGRDENGKLTGAVLEVNAVNYLIRALPALPPALTELILRWKLADYARGGFTTIGVLGTVGRAEDPIRLLQEMADDPHVPVRSVVYGLPAQLDLDSKPDANHDARFELRGVKFWMDGSPYTGGAAFAEPYEDSELTREQLHLPPGHMGPLNYELEEFTRGVRAFSSRRLSRGGAHPGRASGPTGPRRRGGGARTPIRGRTTVTAWNTTRSSPQSKSSARRHSVSS